MHVGREKRLGEVRQKQGQLVHVLQQFLLVRQLAARPANHVLLAFLDLDYRKYLRPLKAMYTRIRVWIVPSTLSISHDFD